MDALLFVSHVSVHRAMWLKGMETHKEYSLICRHDLVYAKKTFSSWLKIQVIALFLNYALFLFCSGK